MLGSDGDVHMLPPASTLLLCTPMSLLWPVVVCRAWLLVWASSFVFLSTHLLPPSYCQLLHQCALHLGCWTRCIHDENASMWGGRRWSWEWNLFVTADIVLASAVGHWIPFGRMMSWSSGTGSPSRGEGLQNVVIPCDSSQECFYVSLIVVWSHTR